VLHWWRTTCCVDARVCCAAPVVHDLLRGCARVSFCTGGT